jgi:putative membrane protein
MLRTYLSVTMVLVLAALVGTAAQQNKEKSGKGQQATITKVDAKNRSVTVKMKDKNGKETERTFKLTDDIRYFDSTGKVAAIDVFRSGDYVLVVEADGRLTELRSDRDGKSAKSGKSDSEFLHAAAEINMAEVKLGKLAQDKSSTPAAKQFGEHLKKDHAKMNEELRTLAQKHGAKLPDMLDTQHQNLYEKLSKMTGADFDQMFAKKMVEGHEKAIEKFEAEAKNGQNADVKAYAEKWLPTLREHLRMARGLNK